MNPDLEHLIVLQAQDLELARLRSDLAELPRRLERARAAVVTAEAARRATQGALAAEEKLRRGHESEIGTWQSKTARLRRSLETATSAEQVKAFEHEIQFGETAIRKLEDQELASMERTEQLEGDLQRADAEWTRHTAALATDEDQARRNTESWSAQVAGIEQQRTELRAGIAGDALALYDRLRKSKGTAVAEALGNSTQGKCAACQMGVRPQRWQDLIGRDHQDEIFSCESCGRMLFWDPRRDTPKAWEVGDRLRRANSGSAR